MDHYLSESGRNLAQPISIWTWSKVVKGIAERSGVMQFTTHTPRHLCLTDLARSGWDIHEIAQFAGHRSIQSTLLYIHLSGRKLGAKIEAGTAAIHTWRVELLAEMLDDETTTGTCRSRVSVAVACRPDKLRP